MAKFTSRTPGLQELSFAIPDIGQAFLAGSPGDRDPTIGIRQGNQILRTTLSKIGREAGGITDPNASIDPLVQAGREALSSQGINLESLSTFNPANVYSLFKGGTGLTEGLLGLSQLSSLKTSQPQAGGDVTKIGEKTQFGSLGKLQKTTETFQQPQTADILEPEGFSPEVQQLLSDPTLAETKGFFRAGEGKIFQKGTNRLVAQGSADQPTTGGSASPTATPSVPSPQITPTLNADDYLSHLESTLSGVSSNQLITEKAEAQTARDRIFEALTAQQGAATKIFSDLLEDFDIKGKRNLLSELDRTILDEKIELREIPDTLRKQLQRAGVTKRQLDNLINLKSKPQAEVLRDLLEQRNVLASDINTSMSYVQSFTNLQLKDQAVKLEGLKFMLDLEEGDVEKLEDKQKEILSLALDQQKDILKVADDAIAGGASDDIVNRILESGDSEEARRLFGESGVGAEQKEGFSEPFTLGNSIVQRNLATGEIERVGGTGGGEEDDGLGGGDREIDSQIRSAGLVDASSETKDGFRSINPEQRRDFINSGREGEEEFTNYLEEIQGTPEGLIRVFTPYKEQGFSRKQAEELWRTSNNWESKQKLPPHIEQAFDSIWGKGSFLKTLKANIPFSKAAREAQQR